MMRVTHYVKKSQANTVRVTHNVNKSHANYAVDTCLALCQQIIDLYVGASRYDKKITY